MVVAGVAAALSLLALERAGDIPQWLLTGPFPYDGSPAGARAILSVIASSMIAVAGTVFSITIAALSLAAGQMGPRLLRNFTKDRGNQITFGFFLATFAYALLVLRAVRDPGEGAFVPQLSLSIAILLAFVCVGTLVWFVAHMAGRINVDTVIELVSFDVHEAVERLTTNGEQPEPPPASFWQDAQTIADPRYGYLQQLDAEALADWAVENDTAIRLLTRPGAYVFPGAPVALVKPPRDDAKDAIVRFSALGQTRLSPADLEFAVRQLEEVAVRALSTGINDPHTAINVLDRMGTALCQLVPLRLPTGTYQRDGRTVLVVPGFDYGGLTDAMFHMIRQNAADTPAVLIRILEILTSVASCEKDAARLETLHRHANLVLDTATRTIPSPNDLADVRSRHNDFLVMRNQGALALACRED